MTAFRRVAWRYPHWWTAALSAIAWAWLVERWWEAGHRHADSGGFSWPDWGIMVVAMMMPLVFANMRFAAARSLWERRHRAIVAFLCGYAGTWLLVGLAAWAATSVMGLLQAGDLPSTAAAAFGAAALWQLVPWKRRALVACHRTMPLAPRGWRADRDCLLYGWATGTRCIVACGVMMLACVFARHTMAAMVCATAIAGAERYNTIADARLTSTMLAVIAVGFVVPGF